MFVSLRSTIIDGVSGKNNSFLAESALETHCFVLGGNEFRLRVQSLRRESDTKQANYIIENKKTAVDYLPRSLFWLKYIKYKILCEDKSISFFASQT